MHEKFEIPLSNFIKNLSFDEAKKFKEEQIWKNLGCSSVEDAISKFLDSLQGKTKRAYKSAFNELIKRKFINPFMSLQDLSLINHNSIIDNIKLEQDWKETTKQARIACYISFTRFLSRRTQGLFPKAVPSKDGIIKTFFKYYEKAKTPAITQSQWVLFFKELEKINERDCLIGKITLQGAKRISEVLSLEISQIDFNERKITFYQKKTRGKKITVVFFSLSIMQKLKEFVQDRSGYVFITKKGTPVSWNHIYRNFIKASQNAKLPVRVTPHVLRVSAITFLKNQGFKESDIQKISGHSSVDMINYCDKSSIQENPSRHVNLIF